MVVVLVASIVVGASTACSKRWGMVIAALTGLPIPGAIVTLADHTGAVFTTTTNADGNYLIENLPIDFYAITVSVAGFVPQTRKATDDQIAAQWQLAGDPAPGNDVDGDGMSAATEQAFGTNPTLGDSDSDGIPDRLESLVSAPLGLPGLRSDPRRRDIFIEIDRDSVPRGTGSPLVTQSAIDQMLPVYQNGPLANPDGSIGITPHIDNGQLGGGTAVNVPAGWGCGTFGGYDGIDQLAPERRNVFFHVTSTDLSTCGLYGIAYGTRRVAVDVGQPQLATLQDMVAAGTILHELGHTKGLSHGGNDGLQCKPNYPSVMSYNPVPVILNGGLDYSRGLQLPVDEAAIDETQPLYSYPQYDWNHNGIIDTVTYPKDVDNFSWLEPAVEALMTQVFSPARCPVNGISPTPLTDFDDWGRIDQNLGQVVGRPMAVAASAPAVIGP